MTDAYHPGPIDLAGPMLRRSGDVVAQDRPVQARPDFWSWLIGRRPARTPAGTRIFAIGDIHGRADLLDSLLAKIARDCAQQPSAGRPSIVFIGDYIDRGVHSRGVIERILAVPREEFDVYCVRGNHEAALLTFLEHPSTGPRWLSLGGRETMFSYGVKPPAPTANEFEFRRAASALRAAMPPAHLKFLQRLHLYIRLGDYLFVHAGLRPGRPLLKQSEIDLLEIREPFLTSKVRWPFVVVHGHSPVSRASSKDGRIRLDTGAYATGRLSAVRLEGDGVTFLTA